MQIAESAFPVVGLFALFTTEEFEKLGRISFVLLQVFISNQLRAVSLPVLVYLLIHLSYIEDVSHKHW